LCCGPGNGAVADDFVQLGRIHKQYPALLEAGEPEEDQHYDDSLPTAIAQAYASNPALAAHRYELRATDDEIGIALSQIRLTAQAEVAGGYDLTLPGITTNAARPLSDRLNDPNIEKNDFTSLFVVDQPIWTGGRASSAFRAATAASFAGREALRGAEGDLLLDLIVAYADVRRDTSTLTARQRNLAALRRTLEEIVARRDAMELTRTDIAQAEVQLQAAQVQLQSAEAQLQASRASFAAIVGRAPGKLSPEPELPGLPTDLDAAFAQAEVANPELAAAIASERESRARVAVARAAGAPQINLRGTAGTKGPAVPFDRLEQDINFSGRLTISIPLSAGGRVRSQIAQAQNRNAADELRIEAAKRQLVQSIVVAWNQWASSERNVSAQELQLGAARIFYEGSYAEYREGLRSTFDVLYAQNSVRDAEIGLLAFRRDSYVARAALLRRIGSLEAAKLLTTPVLYDPARYTRAAQDRNALPWDKILRTIDGIGAPRSNRTGTKTLPVAPAQLVPVTRVVSAPIDVSTRVEPPVRQVPKNPQSKPNRSMGAIRP
jgi:outer membrane protein